MFISVAIIRTIVAVTKQAGVEPEALLDKAQLRPDLLDDPSRLLSLSDFDRLVRTAIALSKDPALGLHVAEQAPLAMLHVVGHMVSSCATLRDAFHMFLRFLPLIEPEARYSLLESGTRAHYVYMPAASPEPAILRFHAECCILFTYRLARNMLTVKERATSVRFAYGPPSYAAEYARAFDCEVKFGQAENAIEFDRSALDHPLAHADSGMFTAVRERAEELLRRRAGEDDVAVRVAELLRYERSLAGLDEKEVARRMHTAPRTLRRRLAASGQPFSRLLDEARRERACQELALPGACAKAVAETLGFSEPSALRRAFKRWTGTTIGDYVRSRGGGAADAADDVDAGADEAPVEPPDDGAPDEPDVARAS